jgi:N-acetylmuramoyl-L-alanine amidase
VLDPGHGGDDLGVVVGDVNEAELVWDLASRIEGRLTALGVQTWLTRGPHIDASEEQRAQLANDVSADLVLSLHIDGSQSPLANGVAAYYYGAGESASTIGERLADLAQRELVARTGMGDNRIHGKTWALLRLTRMPAVRVEIGYLTSRRDRELLRQPQFRDTVAEGLLVAVQRLYLPTADDPPTGAMRLPA